MNYEKFHSQREQLQAEINAPHTKIKIDRTIFMKTEEERKLLKIAKSDYKKRLNK